MVVRFSGYSTIDGRVSVSDLSFTGSDAFYSSTVLLLTDQNTSDQSPAARSPSALVGMTTNPDSRGSFNKNSTADRWEFASSTDFDVTNGVAFTVEMDFRPTTTANQALLYRGDSFTARFGLYIDSGKAGAQVYNGSSYIQLASTSNVVANDWNTIAYVYDGSTFRLFFNGVQEDTAGTTGTLTSGTNWISIGYFRNVNINVSHFIGDVANIRWTNGVARYGTGGYTPVTSILPLS